MILIIGIIAAFLICGESFALSPHGTANYVAGEVNENNHRLKFILTEEGEAAAAKIHHELLELSNRIPSLKPFLSSLIELVSDPSKWENGASLRKLGVMGKRLEPTIIPMIIEIFHQYQIRFRVEAAIPNRAEQMVDFERLFERDIPGFVRIGVDWRVPVEFHWGEWEQVKRHKLQRGLVVRETTNHWHPLKKKVPVWHYVQESAGAQMEQQKIVVTDIAGTNVIGDLAQKLAFLGMMQIDVYMYYTDHFDNIQQALEEARGIQNVPLTICAMGRSRFLAALRKEAWKLYLQAGKNGDFKTWLENKALRLHKKELAEVLKELGIWDVWVRLTQKLKMGSYNYRTDSDLMLILTQLRILSDEVKYVGHRNLLQEQYFEGLYSAHIAPLLEAGKRIVVFNIPRGDQSSVIADVLCQRSDVKGFLFLGSCGFLDLDLKRRFGIRIGDMVIPKKIETRDGKGVKGYQWQTTLKMVTTELRKNQVPFEILDLSSLESISSRAINERLLGSSKLWILLTHHTSVSSYLEETRQNVHRMKERGIRTVDMESASLAQTLTAGGIQFMMVSHITDFVGSGITEESSAWLERQQYKNPWFQRNYFTISDIATSIALQAEEMEFGAETEDSAQMLEIGL